MESFGLRQDYSHYYDNYGDEDAGFAAPKSSGLDIVFGIVPVVLQVGCYYMIDVDGLASSATNNSGSSSDWKTVQ